MGRHERRRDKMHENSKRSTSLHARLPWSVIVMWTVATGLVLGALVYWLNNSTNTKVTAAVLTFFGVLITAGAKQLIDTQSERRLRLDAAINAGKLLSPSDGCFVSAAAAASGLLALTDLGRSKLATAMLVDLWAKDIVSPEVAILVVDKALATGDDSTAQIAAEVLCQNSHKLDSTKPAHWPSILDERWLPSATEKTKLLLVEALIEMSTNTQLSPGSLRSFVVRIVSMQEREGPGHFKKCLAGFVGAVAPALAGEPSGDTSHTLFIDGDSKLDYAYLCKIAEEFKENPDTLYRKIAESRRGDLREWATECRKSDLITKAGAMANPSCAENLGAGVK
jgi:hypothetical protein